MKAKSRLKVKSLLTGALTLGCTLTLGAAVPAAHAADIYSGGHAHMVTPDELVWKPAPAVGKGVEIAVIEGPLDKPVPFMFRLRMPANTVVAPHTHPTYERVTVLSGTFYFAHGDKFDKNKLRALKPGSVAIMPPGAAMFGHTQEQTVIQLNGTGPWGLAYLNPADDPRKAN